MPGMFQEKQDNMARAVRGDRTEWDKFWEKVRGGNPAGPGGLC